ncbi:alpha/beta fold hydrolase [Prosthecomicrobium hirschii]|uniref:alpha/beta fold hydrolase n=1 Tax=Prosthecodimorpha hirschii TaxID=665126 RepID=UPI00221F0860|nr:alpha/beta fold hydrolase [Prosthecomicrobium hirschii]MCW1840449.1 alpha/beta fold hydrolase [Prosthecomicrobium hirschii]
MTSATSHFVDLDGVSLHYLTAGQGDPVLLVHGIPQTSYEWRHIMPRLAERYTVIAPDLRGLGDSSRPATGYDKKTIAADLWALTRRLGIDRFHLAGHDWGGPVAFSLAAHHREAVKSLAILDVVIPGDGADFSQGGRRWHHAFFRTLDLPEALCIGREELVLGWLFDNYGHRPNAIPPADQEEYFRSYRKFGTFRAMLEFYRALPTDAADNRANLDRLGKLTMPVLALGGEKAFGRGMECIESLRRVAEDVRGGSVPECGHWIPEEQPEFLVEALMQFFTENDRR